MSSSPQKITEENLSQITKKSGISSQARSSEDYPDPAELADQQASKSAATSSESQAEASPSPELEPQTVSQTQQQVDPQDQTKAKASPSNEAQSSSFASGTKLNPEFYDENGTLKKNPLANFERNRYPLPQIALHWVVLLLTAFAYFTIFGGNAGIHMVVGYVILILGIVRIIFRIRYKKLNPPVYPPQTKSAKISSTLLKITLLLWFIIIPVFGILAVNADTKAMQDSYMAWHKIFAYTGLVLIILHAALAIYQHVVKKNDSLLRMSPH